MDEQVGWKGQSFTLVVFAGIVFLCSIFFALGMLVGRSQGQKIASAAMADAEAKRAAAAAAVKPDQPELTFYQHVEEVTPPTPVLESVLDPAPEPQDKPESTPPPPSGPSTPSVNFQISAVRRSADADKLLDEVRKQGFKAFILAPAPGDDNPFYRIQVGPYSASEAEDMRQKLLALRYQPIKK